MLSQKIIDVLKNYPENCVWAPNEILEHNFCEIDRTQRTNYEYYQCTKCGLKVWIGISNRCLHTKCNQPGPFLCKTRMMWNALK